METIYNVDYFIKKFQVIPEDKWAVGTRANEMGARCALGWCYPTHQAAKESENGTTIDDSPEDKALCKLFNRFRLWPAMVNNGIEDQPYKQPTPKQRILAALYDIYEKTYGRKYGEEPKEKVIYKTVVIDSKVKELQETLTEN